MLSHSVSLGKWHEGSELTNTFTDNPYLKGTTGPTPVQSSKVTGDLALCTAPVGSGVTALLLGCLAACAVSLPSMSGC